MQRKSELARVRGRVHRQLESGQQYCAAEGACDACPYASPHRGHISGQPGDPALRPSLRSCGKNSGLPAHEPHARFALLTVTITVFAVFCVALRCATSSEPQFSTTFDHQATSFRRVYGIRRAARLPKPACRQRLSGSSLSPPLIPPSFRDATKWRSSRSRPRTRSRSRPNRNPPA